MGRTGFVWGIFALLAFIGSLFIPFLNTFLPFLAVIALGWGAGYTAAKVTGAVAGQRLGRGAGAGAIAGLVVTLGIVALFTLLFGVARNVIANNPGLQAQIDQVLQQSPNASGVPISQLINQPGLLPAVALGSFCFGLIPLVLMAIAGLVGGLMWRGTPDRGEYVAAGRSGAGTSFGSTGTASTYDTGSTTGTGYGATGTTGTGYSTTGTASTYDTGTTGTTGYGSTTGTTGTTGDQGDGEGGVRVYDTDDRNRM